MTFDSLTENEEHDIPSQILKTILDCTPRLFLDPKYVWFLADLLGLVVPNSSGQVALIVCIIPPE